MGTTPARNSALARAHPGKLLLLLFVTPLYAANPAPALTPEEIAETIQKAPPGWWIKHAAPVPTYESWAKTANNAKTDKEKMTIAATVTGSLRYHKLKEKIDGTHLFTYIAENFPLEVLKYILQMSLTPTAIVFNHAREGETDVDRRNYLLRHVVIHEIQQANILPSVLAPIVQSYCGNDH